MRSLRSRLIAGSILIAIVPLAVVTWVLSRQIATLVRTQAEQRLTAVLEGLKTQIEADGGRLDQQLDRLARDGTLKRTYLLQPAGSRDLSEMLADRRVLLGLDFLQIADTRGVTIADASEGAAPTAIEDRDSTRAWTNSRRVAHGIGMVHTDGDPVFAIVAAAPIPYEGESVGTVRGGLRLDSAFFQRLKASSGVDFAMEDGLRRVRVATSAWDPDRDARTARPSRNISLAVAARGQPFLRFAWVGRAPTVFAVVFATIPTTEADHNVRALQITSALLALAGLVLAVLLGVFWSSQVSRPVERLAAFSERVAHGEWDEPLRLRSVRELETLVDALDRMRADLRGYRARLVTSERHAAWSRMAQTVAHEVKNPLTPIAVSIADLKRSYEQGRPDFAAILDSATRTVGEEIEALKRMLQEFSEFARLPAPRIERCDAARLLDDLAAIHRGDVAAGRLVVARPAEGITFDGDPDQLRRALINLVKNGLEATAAGGRVAVSARSLGDAVEIAVADDGPGLSEEQRSHLFEPGFTTKAAGSGLGLTIVERIVSEHGGAVTAEDAPPHGTRFLLRLPCGRRA